MRDKEYVKVYCCADCAHYDMKKHRCRNGAKDEGTGREHFYRDCRLGIHNENESVPIEVLQEIRQEIEKPLRQEMFFDTADAKAQYIALNWVCELIDKHIKEISDEM